MSCSPARLAANRRNASKSTGPKSPEGKAASRLNAFRHGMAGRGDLPGPEDDLALVERRAAAFARELKADGESGRLMARRAALLSVRMDRMASREMLDVAAKTVEGRDQFDAELAEQTDRMIADLEGADPQAARLALEGFPDGLARLIPAWIDLGVELESQGPPSSLARDRALSRLGLADTLSNPEIITRINAEVDRLQGLLDSDTMGEQIQEIAQARINAGVLAGFDISPEATLGRRYEAAAERGFYRAIRTIRELNRAAARDQGPDETTAPAPDARPPVAAAPPSTPRPTTTPLASFRAAVPPSPPPMMRPFETLANPTPSTPDARKKRPDLKKAARKLAASRR